MAKDDPAPRSRKDAEARSKHPLAHLQGQRPPAPDWFKAMQAAPVTESSTEVEGASIAWRRWGDPGAPGVMLVHGGMAHKGWWDMIGPALAEEGRCVAALDLSGMGESGWREAYRMDLYAQEVIAVAEDAGLFEAEEKPAVFGHSFGGWTTLNTARHYGERLRCAVMLDSPIRPPGDQRMSTPPGRPRRVYDSAEEGLSRFRLLPEQECDNEFLLDHIARQSLKPETKKDGSEGWTWRFDPHLWSRLTYSTDHPSSFVADIACPLGALRGADSALVTDEIWAYMHEMLPAGSPMISIPEAKHHLMMDQPIAVIAAIRALLEGWAR